VAELTEDDFLSLPLPDFEPSELDELDELLELDSPEEPEEPFLDSPPVDDDPFAPAVAGSLPAPTVLAPFRLSVR
jgi:hypothetical protein